jgi:type VI secretion system protein ImpA
MASPPLLSFDELLEPIPGDNPAGESVPFTVRQQLEEYRKEINPNEFDEDDPRRPAEFKRAEWDSIIELAQDILKNTSKDLLVAARLTEALTREHGYGGLRDGFHLMRLLVEQCWDRLNPSIEDGDLEVRAAPFNWLDDPDRGARFPTTVRLVPLVLLDEQKIGWLQWKQLQEGKGDLTADDFEKAVAQTPREHCQSVVDDLAEVRAEMSQLLDVLNGLLGEHAPALSEVARALGDSDTLAKQILQRKGPAPSAEPEEAEQAEQAEEPAAAAEGTEAATGAMEKAPRRGRSREDIYRQLRDAANQLQQMEPHSPIPYLIQKAVQWGSLPFPQLIRALVRDQNIIAELNRELGIADEAQEGTPEQE